MKVIVDTNIVFSAILNSQSWIGQILLHSDKSMKFYSPKFLQKEILNHIGKIKKLTGLSGEEVAEVIDILYSKINFISEEFIPNEILLKADELTRHVDFDDVLFVALSIHLKCKLWTGDKVLMEKLSKNGFNKFITTPELKARLNK